MSPRSCGGTIDGRPTRGAGSGCICTCSAGCWRVSQRGSPPRFRIREHTRVEDALGGLRGSPTPTAGLGTTKFLNRSGKQVFQHSLLFFFLIFVPRNILPRTRSCSCRCRSSSSACASSSSASSASSNAKEPSSRNPGTGALAKSRPGSTPTCVVVAVANSDM